MIFKRYGVRSADHFLFLFLGVFWHIPSPSLSLFPLVSPGGFCSRPIPGIGTPQIVLLALIYIIIIIMSRIILKNVCEGNQHVTA
jgi:hypothetical protein